MIPGESSRPLMSGRMLGGHQVTDLLFSEMTRFTLVDDLTTTIIVSVVEAVCVALGVRCLHLWEGASYETACCALCGAASGVASASVERRLNMHQKINERHEINAVGNPGGGETTALGITVKWQTGPLGHGGATVEDVIRVAIGRLRFFQTSPGGLEGKPGAFACRENALALTKLEEALMWCEARTHDREERVVEGTYTP